MSPLIRAAILCGLMLPLRAQDQPPVFPNAFTGYAEVETTAGFNKAGWASLVTAGQGGEVYIVSTRYLLGPGGGFRNQVAGENVTAFVRNIQIDSLAAGAHGYFVNAFAIPALDLDTLKTPLDDVAIYQVHTASAQEPTVPLATQLPAQGDTVWFISKAPKTTELAAEAATVISADSDGWLTVKLKSGVLDKNASGTPFLNSAGELVGIFSHADATDATKLDVISSLTLIKVLLPGKS